MTIFHGLCKQFWSVISASIVIQMCLTVLGPQQLQQLYYVSGFMEERAKVYAQSHFQQIYHQLFLFLLCMFVKNGEERKKS